MLYRRPTEGPDADPDNDACTCRHEQRQHNEACGGLDSYGLPCTCPSFELDLNVVKLCWQPVNR